MGLNKVTADSIADGTIIAADILDGTITVAKLVSGTLPSAAANSGSSYANSAFLSANTPSNVANSAATYANSAFTRANNSINANTGGTITGDLAVTNNISFYGPILEKSNVVTTGGLTATINISTAESGLVVFTSNSSANSTINFTGLSSIPVGNVASYVIFVPNSTSPKYISAYQIDGSSVTPKWAGGAPTGGTSANTDMYSFNIVKTSATPTYNVFAQVSSFF